MIIIVKNKFKFDGIDIFPEHFELIDRKTINVQFELMPSVDDADQLLITEQNGNTRTITFPGYIFHYDCILYLLK